MNFSFTMPLGVDPPVKKYLNNSSVGATADDLSPTNGVELHGRPLSVVNNQLVYMDVTQVKVQFVCTGKVSVKSFVGKGFKNFKPWTVQTSVDPSTNTWTLIFTIQPGSARLSDWDQTGGVLPQGFFGSMTAEQGNTTASITNVTITPIGAAMNANQRPAHDVVDVTAPTVTAFVDKPTIWSPNGNPVDVTFTSNLMDTFLEDANNYVSGLNPSSISVTLTQVDGDTTTPLGNVPFQITDNGGGSYGVTALLSLTSTRNGFNVEGRIYYITISARDYAGNLTETTATVTVQHDQSP